MEKEAEIVSGEIISHRVFNFPCELVFQAWSNPVHLARWWGPKGFTNTFHEFDFRPGGIWNFVMHGPDGTGYPNVSQFVRIEEPEQIIFDHLSQHRFRAIASFKPVENGKTSLVFRMYFESAEECRRVREYILPANEENFDRLQSELEKMIKA